MAAGRVTELGVSTSAGAGRVTELTVASGSNQGRVTELTAQSALSQGRVTELTVQIVPAALGWLGVAGVWTPVRGWLGVGGVWTPVKRWSGEVIIIDPPDPPDPPVGTTRGPVQFGSVAEARALLGAPTDANYVVWDPAWDDEGLMLHEVFTSKLGANDILVLPERIDGAGNPIPYLIRSDNGFMAAGVSWITGSLPNDTPNSRIPITPNPRCWFEMARGRRGILGMGPNTVIEPSPSAFTRPPQPITEQTGGTMAAYNAAGAKLQDLVGAQDTLMSFDHANPWTANFTLRSRSMGGVAYSGLRTRFAKNIFFDAASRGHAGVPNGETGCIRTDNGTYQYENIEVKTTDATGARVVTSPIMWNRTTGGTMTNVKTGRPIAGMFTLWRCDGTNTWTDVIVEGDSVSLNCEEGGAAWVLNWTGGSINTQGQYHIVGESSGGSKKITLNNVTVTGGRDSASGALATHFYSYTGTTVQRKSDITRINPAGPVTGYAFMV